ncbi:pilus assembly protein PilO [Bacillus sp. RO1]|uniref:pilus assembly protein PilO n=1 Tax=Bacillus sp. RO1 TaxID=2722703 RepID=UPI00145735DF|nr:pilus assembly protein PilO [Bacillus sp. RO1]NLP50307.1 pilus assembly protein PilO [Bacillus sp. RO1]
MMIELERKHYVLLSSCVLLIVLGIAGFYYLSYAPKEVRAEQLQQEKAIEEQLIQVLEQQEVTAQANGNTTVELQRKIPVTPFLEQLILELEKAEVLSDSTIVNMSFGEEEFVPATTTLEEYETMHDEEDETVEEEAYLPEGLKKVTVNLSVESEVYEDLSTFLSSLESLTRITQIESVSFTGQPEVTSTDQELQPLTYSVTLSAFYHPELDDLIEELPPLSVPEPANRVNPFIDND